MSRSTIMMSFGKKTNLMLMNYSKSAKKTKGPKWNYQLTKCSYSYSFYPISWCRIWSRLWAINKIKKWMMVTIVYKTKLCILANKMINSKSWFNRCWSSSKTFSSSI